MSEERLKEIQKSIFNNLLPTTDVDWYTAEIVNEELELYNEVVRLREIINHAEDLKHIKEMCMHVNEIDNLTLEQLGGIENE